MVLLISVGSFAKLQAQNVAPLDTTKLVGEIEQMIERARYIQRQGDYDLSYSVLDSALQLSKTIDNEPLSAFMYSELGVVCMYQGRYSDALKLMHEGVIIREALNDSVGLAESYNYIASVHHSQTDFSIAIKYYNKSLAILKVLARQNRLENPKLLGTLYNNIGSLYEDQAEYDLALDFHEKSMNIWQNIGDTSWISVSLRHIGVCYQNQGKVDEALEAFMLSYEMSSNGGSTMNVIRACMPIGNLYLELGKPEKARRWCEEAYAISTEVNNLYGIKESCWCLSELYEGMGMSEQALDFYKRSMMARDSIFGHERTKELTRLEMQFVFERQQLADSLMFVKQQAKQERQIVGQQIGWASTGAVLLMIGAMAAIIYRGKKKSDHLLLNILPIEIAEELKEHGATKAKRLDSVTVMFTDFKGFTGVSERLSPEELVGEINSCFSEFDRIMEKHGVEKIKTIGDAYMAAGGVPVQNQAHAEDVVKAALDMQQFMLERKEQKQVQGLEYFEMRVGIHTGPVVAGIVGVKKFQYDIWGDTVNTASRMESSGEAGKVNISEATYELLKDNTAFNFATRGRVKAKGKGEMEMFFVDKRT